MLQLWSEASSTNIEDLKIAAKRLSNGLSLCFSFTIQGSTYTADQENLLVVDDIDHGISADSHVEQAQKFFDQICPGKEFYPPKEDNDNE